MRKVKNNATNLQESRVAPSQMKGEDVVNKPSTEINNSTIPRGQEVEYEETTKGIRKVIYLNREFDTLNSLWSAEKSYYLLYCINYNGELFNKYVLPLRESRLRKPIPHFNTLTAFLEWVINTNPKALKELLRDVLLTMINNDRGLMLPDEGRVAETDAMEKYYKGLSHYMAEHVLVKP